ncbi:hypothetical protein A2W14_05155 [Candidatus Gottesmanbacteria bacterium RBG_16_37_8]|uniref:Uncharacterized protein n=1 Tax=Candidatus Gottesmanbacteria bacterium RBG_16_37_8 TaxID=1798371 RepID=A0A1F5YPW7_9BACT|nr:MAG: hypothetical protein A2W14_05155 [Candidatus Gottesmanbacteria bacterium RBG_16_37_8]
MSLTERFSIFDKTPKYYWWERLGIKQPPSRTVIIATSLNPNDRSKTVDFGYKKNAVWVTCPNIQYGMDMIVGPDGRASDIGILWNNSQPHIFVNGKKLKVTPVKTHFINKPPDVEAVVLKKKYRDHHPIQEKLSDIGYLTESYIFARLPEKSGYFFPADGLFYPLVDYDRVISGCFTDLPKGLMRIARGTNMTKFSKGILPFAR